MQYVQDFDDVLPAAFFGKYGGSNLPGSAGEATDGPKYKWTDASFPYMKNEQVYRCPSTENNGSGVDGRYSFRSSGLQGSYGLNSAYEASGDIFTPPSSRAKDDGTGFSITNRLSQIQAAATTVWVADTSVKSQAYWFRWNDKNSTITLDPGPPRSLYGAGGEGWIIERHLETTNVLFCDGHVKAMRISDLNETKTVNGNANIRTAFTSEDD